MANRFRFLYNKTSCLIFTRRCSNKPNQDADVLKKFNNRNPRSMEILRLAPKPLGFPMDARPIQFWNRLVMEDKGKKLEAYILHSSGKKIFSIDTSDPSISDQLYSLKGAIAAQALGHVVGKRCLQMGLLEVFTEMCEKRDSSERIDEFLSGVEKYGVKLVESRQIAEKENYEQERYYQSFPWEVVEDEYIHNTKDEKED